MGRHADEDRTDKIQIQRVTPRHCSIARAEVAGGLSKKDLARMYGMSQSQISIVTNSPAYISQRQLIEAGADKNAMELKEEILALRDAALRNLADDINMPVMDEKDRALRQKASLAALEIAKLRGSGGITIKGDVIQNQQNNKYTLEELRDNVFKLLEEDED